MDRFAKIAAINGPKIESWLEERQIQTDRHHVFSARAWKIWECVPLEGEQGVRVSLFLSDLSHDSPKVTELFHVSQVRLLEPHERPSRKLPQPKHPSFPRSLDDLDDDED